MNSIYGKVLKYRTEKEYQDYEATGQAVFSRGRFTTDRTFV